MAKEQAREWAAAQNITVSMDLVKAAKTHLKFLDAVEYRNRFLFEDNALQRAVYRYNAFWLPLLAKHEKNLISEESLVVPFDCELIWHCHRLNPVRYNFDCQKLFGRILTNHKVKSSLDATSKSITEEIWSKMYPEEPYDLDLERPFSGEIPKNGSRTEQFTSYDLIAAVKRQIGFTYQACRPHMSDELFLKEAEARYKGFLHLIRTNRKTGTKLSCVPTYDIDLMWHTHQLYPDAYCKDMKELVGGLVQHNDSDPDKSKGSRLDTGFTDTTLQWQRTFGFSYWKAGAMNKGDIPTPVTRSPYKFNGKVKDFDKVDEFVQQIHFPTVKSVEVLLEFVDIKNLPEERKENLVVAVSKKQPDTLFKTKRWVGISSASKDKLFACLECEPTGEFLFELMSYSPASDELKPNRSLKLLGSCSLSFDKLLASRTQLWTSKWVSLDLVPGLENSEPVLLNVSMSFSPPMPAPQVFHLGNCQHFEDNMIKMPLMDCTGKKVFSLQKRSITKDETKCPYDLLTEVHHITDSGEKHTLVTHHENGWFVNGAHGPLKLQKSSKDDDSLFELASYDKIVKLFPGRRLQSRLTQVENEKSKQDFTTMVEFSADYPYGKAVGLINSKLRAIKVMDESLVLPSIALAFLLCNHHRGDEKTDFTIDGKETVSAKGSAMCGYFCVAMSEEPGNHKRSAKSGSFQYEEPANAKGSAMCGYFCVAMSEEPGNHKRSAKSGCFQSEEPTNAKGSAKSGCFQSEEPTNAKGSAMCGYFCVAMSEEPGNHKRSAKSGCFQSKEPTNAKGAICCGIMCHGSCEDSANEGNGAQCIGQCTNCDGDGDVQMKGNGAQCIGQCTNCDGDVVMQMKGNGAQCIGQCTNCDGDGDMQMVNENDEYGVGCDLGIATTTIISGYA